MLFNSRFSAGTVKRHPCPDHVPGCTTGLPDERMSVDSAVSRCFAYCSDGYRETGFDAKPPSSRCVPCVDHLHVRDGLQVAYDGPTVYTPFALQVTAIGS